MNPDYSKYTILELEDILINIDKRAYSKRYQQAKSEYNKKLSDPVQVELEKQTESIQSKNNKIYAQFAISLGIMVFFTARIIDALYSGVNLNNAFHLSIVVPQLRLAEAFYVNFLGCKKGRDTGKWIDIIFFGHQLTLHQETEKIKAQSIDHFGVILVKTEWLSLAKKIEVVNYPFILSPNEKINDDNSESGKFIIKDPASNIIEFKFYQKSSVDLLS
ncbi:hypothetical protein [Colwellia piezophila]|uniref:hypothetical protein n=1 Tax=Colwellia piezophila TaxID=211668 RepID=UPI0003A29A53|nr:hypothetical protein [Colwellia piezophila]